MKSVLISIAMVVGISVFMGFVNFLYMDFIFCMLSASVIGVVFVVSSLARGENPDQAMRYLLFSIIGASALFTVTWTMLVLLGGFMGVTAMAFDLVIGILGACAGAALCLRSAERPRSA